MDNDIQNSGLRVRDVPRFHCESPAQFRAELATRREPAIVTGLASKWPAATRWSLEYLRETYGALRFRVGVRMPTDSSPYEQVAADFIEEMPLRRALDQIEARDEATYVRRQHIEKFPGAAQDIEIFDLSPTDGRPKNCFMWIGKNTLTGLHFDFSQGLLCQILGRKTVYFAAPEDSMRLSPILGSVSKTNFLPSDPDFVRFPKARDVVFWRTGLEPGEVLIVPRLWWHSVIANGVSISVNHDFGVTLSSSEICSAVAAGGLKQFTRVAHDFVYHGVLDRPYVRRLTDDPPFGRLLYDMVAYSVRARFSSKNA